MSKCDVFCAAFNAFSSEKTVFAPRAARAGRGGRKEASRPPAPLPLAQVSMCNWSRLLPFVIKSTDGSKSDKSYPTIHIKVHVRVIEMLCDFAVLKITLEGVCCAELLWDGKCMIQKEFIHCNITHVSRNK